MFLATTAISEFWDTRQEMLFLGSWCLSQDQGGVQRGSVMACPWNDRRRYYEAAERANQHYEAVLGHLANYLNEVHGVRHELRYWRILIGPWLWHFVHALYDRRTHLLQALEQHPDLETLTVDPNEVRASRGTADLIDLLGRDAFNLRLYSELLDALGYRFPRRPLPGGSMLPDVKAQAGLPRAARRAAGSLMRSSSRALAWLRGQGWRVALTECYVPRRMTWALSLASGLRALPYDVSGEWSDDLPDATLNDSRTGLADLLVNGAFERILVSTLPHHLPAAYLEGYANARRQALRRWPAQPAMIVSAVGWFYNEPFKYLAAEAADRGSRIVTVQHGGGYGIFRCMSAELHEREIADSFLAWGWAGPDTDGCRNVPNPKLSKLTHHHTRRSDQARSHTILFVATAHPRYLFRFHSMPVGSQWAEYLDWQRRFFVRLSPALRDTVAFRPYPEDYGHHVATRLTSAFPDVRADRRGVLSRRIQDARLVVVDHSATTYLECLVANVPTVVFWDPDRWETRPAATPFFDDLRRVGILWDAPESAAVHVQDVFNDPGRWWSGEELQNVRRRFVDRFALGVVDWLPMWSNALREELDAAESMVGNPVGSQAARPTIAPRRS